MNRHIRPEFRNTISLSKGQFALGGDDALLFIFFVITSEKKKMGCMVTNDSVHT